MSHRYHEFDMSRTFAAHLFLGYFNAATVANDALIAYALVLSAGTFVILRRTEDAFAEKTIALGLVCTVVNGFGFGNLTIRIFQDFFGRSQSDGNLREIVLYLCIFLKSHFTFSIKGVN